jgi:2-iminobutanoate/2-iminopropanoate deaminase
MRQAIHTTKGVQPAAPYSQGIVASGRSVYVSGQGSFSPETGQFEPGDFAAQAERTFRNVQAILEAAGAGWQDVVKVNIYLASITDFAAMNEIYRRFVVEPYPARTTIQAVLSGQMLIEVDCIAVVADSAPDRA